MRGVLKYLIHAVAAVVILAGCATPTPPPEPVTLRFAFPTGDLDQNKRLVEQFNKSYPHIKVELLSRRWDTITGIDAAGADVILTTQFALDDMRRRGGLLSLDQLIASDQKVNKDDFLPNALRMFVDSGKTWALPAGLDPQVVYFNKDLFDRRKVAYPAEGWTRDDFAEKALALREASSGVFGYAVVSDFLDPILFVYQHGGKLFDNLEAPTRTTFDDPKTIEAIDWYSELNKQSNAILTPEAAAALGGGNVSSVIRGGRAGMWIGPLSMRGGRLDRAPWPMKWGMVPLPRDAQSATMATASGYAITTQCKTATACWQFIAFLSQQQPVSFSPARRSLIKSATGLDADVAKVAQAATDSSLMIRGGDLGKLEQAIGVFTQAVNAVLSGQATAAEALAAAQANSPMK